MDTCQARPHARGGRRRAPPSSWRRWGGRSNCAARPDRRERGSVDPQELGNHPAPELAGLGEPRAEVIGSSCSVHLCSSGLLDSDGIKPQLRSHASAGNGVTCFPFGPLPERPRNAPPLLDPRADARGRTPPIPLRRSHGPTCGSLPSVQEPHRVKCSRVVDGGIAKRDRC